jgi:hypothetical protein
LDGHSGQTGGLAILGLVKVPGNCSLLIPRHQQKAWIFSACQEYMVDKKAPDTRFDQCLQGFRVLKKLPTMGCTVFPVYAKILE